MRENQKPLSLRSIAFNATHIPYLLIRQSKNLYVARLDSDATLKVLRKVPSKYWWFKITQDEKGNEIGLFMDEDEITAYPLTSEARGKKLSKDLDNFHLTTATSNSRPCFIINDCIHVYENDGLINLDENPSKRLSDEENAIFFAADSGGIIEHHFNNKPGDWYRLCENDDFEYSAYKQMTYNPIEKVVVSIIGMRKGLGWFQFIDLKGNIKTYSTPKGVWSAACFQGRNFFYEWGNVVEVTQNGKKKSHNINGTIVRNQCLFSSPDALYFVCEEGLYLFKNESWTFIDIPNKQLIL